HAVHRAHSAVRANALDQHDEQDHAEGQHQLRRELEIHEPLHGSLPDDGKKRPGRICAGPGYYLIVASLTSPGERTAISARLASRWIVPSTQTSRPSSSS